MLYTVALYVSLCFIPNKEAQANSLVEAQRDCQEYYPAIYQTTEDGLQDALNACAREERRYLKSEHYLESGCYVID